MKDKEEIKKLVDYYWYGYFHVIRPQRNYYQVMVNLNGKIFREEPVFVSSSYYLDYDRETKEWLRVEKIMRSKKIVYAKTGSLGMYRIIYRKSSNMYSLIYKMYSDLCPFVGKFVTIERDRNLDRLKTKVELMKDENPLLTVGGYHE